MKTELEECVGVTDVYIVCFHLHSLTPKFCLQQAHLQKNVIPVIPCLAAFK